MSLLEPPQIACSTTTFSGRRSDTADKFCILGAGSSGLTVAKNFHEQGIPYDCLEREDEVGGNWNLGASASSVYQSTRMISSKALTEYTDYPMPADYPDQPPQTLVGPYLRSYAEHFGLYANIEFNTRVRWIAPAVGSGWIITLDDGEQRRYRGVVIANGHNWEPRWPCYTGQFEGTVLHSAEYKTPDVLTGRRVLVVGGGNSGFDIATESARYAGANVHSLRRGYHLLPRFFEGQPIDACGEWMLQWRLPLWVRRLAAARTRRLTWGSSPLPGAPQPDHKLFETHPAINSRWPEDVRRGAITVKPDICELQGISIKFADGSCEQIDTILFATGYKLSLPFLSAADWLVWQAGRPQLFLNIFHPDRDDLFIAGLIQPDSGQFGLVDCQAQLIAAYVRALSEQLAAEARSLQKHKRDPQSQIASAARYVASPRHLFEVEHFSYRRSLNLWIKRLQCR